MVNAVAWHLRDCPAYDPNDPAVGLVHRIDKDTSGLLVVAKTPEAKTSLGVQFFNKTTRRTYNALVWSNFQEDEGRIEGNIGRDVHDRLRMAVYQPESGVIKKDGEVVKINNPNDATALHIGMVHQHFKLVECFTVLDNIILGAEPMKGPVVDRAAARKKVVELSDRYGLKVDPDALVEDISVGMQHRGGREDLHPGKQGRAVSRRERNGSRLCGPEAQDLRGRQDVRPPRQ